MDREAWKSMDHKESDSTEVTKYTGPLVAQVLKLPWGDLYAHWSLKAISVEVIELAWVNGNNLPKDEEIGGT